MKIKALLLALATLAFLPSVQARDQDSRQELFELTKETGYNFCFVLINKDSGRQNGLNRFRVSPSQACECTSTETATAMEANRYYHAYLRNLIRGMDISKGETPRFEYERDQDEAVKEYTAIFNRSWANCFQRLMSR